MKLRPFLLAALILFVSTMTAFADEIHYGPFSIKVPNGWTLYEEDGMLTADHDVYPFKGFLYHTSLPSGMTFDQKAINKTVFEFGTPTEYKIGDHPAAYVVFPATNGSTTRKAIFSCVSYGNTLLSFIGLDFTNEMSDTLLFSMAYELLNATTLFEEASAVPVRVDNGSYQLGRFNMRFPAELDIEIDGGSIYAANGDGTTVLGVMLLNLPNDVDSKYVDIKEFFEDFCYGMGATFIEDYSQTIVCGSPAFQFKFDLNKGGMMLKVYGYMVFNGCDAFCIFGMTFADSTDTLCTTVEQTINSLAISE